MLSPFLTSLKLSSIPTLVELPSSLENFSYLEELCIENCTNLEILPTGVDLPFLDELSLDGCTGLRSFPDISTNISELSLNRTGIEEVPWWIEEFSRLRSLHMSRCSKLKYVSLNISKLKNLETVWFDNCGSLTGISWNVRPRMVAMESYNIHSDKLVVSGEASTSLPYDYFPRVSLDCFNSYSLDQEALLQQEMVFKLLTLPGEEVPPYFTHRTTGTSSSSEAILLFQTPVSQQFFRFRACAVVDFENGYLHGYKIHVSIRFRDRFGNNISCTRSAEHTTFPEVHRHLVIFDNCLPPCEDIAHLPKFNYDYMDIRFHLTPNSCSPRLRGCGIRFLENSPSLDNRPCSSNILPHVYEGNKSNMLNLGNHVSEHNQECGDKAIQ